MKGSVEACLRKFLDEDFKQFGVTIEHFHSDGKDFGKDFVTAAQQRYINLSFAA